MTLPIRFSTINILFLFRPASNRDRPGGTAKNFSAPGLHGKTLRPPPERDFGS
jgi:hypothetical protein